MEIFVRILLASPTTRTEEMFYAEISPQCANSKLSLMSGHDRPSPVTKPEEIQVNIRSCLLFFNFH